MEINIKNIIFDVGNVFLIWNPARLFQKYFPTETETEAFFKEINLNNMCAETDKGMPFRTSVDIAAAKFPHHKEKLIAYDTDWEETIEGEVPGTLDLMLKLKNAGLGVYGLSNFPAEKFQLCANKYEFAKHFDGLIVSAEVGEIKPFKPIYEILLSKYNLKPEECVFLDDRQENLDTARELGFKTILFTAAAQAEQKLRALGVTF